MEDTPAALRGARVVFEATVLPNYLANSYFPAEFFREADLVPVGTRATKGVYKTRGKIEEGWQTKSYLLAGDERSVGKIAQLLEASAGGAARAAQERLRQFDIVRLPTVDEIIRSRPEVSDAELLTWEAVLHPAVDAGGEVTKAEIEIVLGKWAEWIHLLGGEVAVDYERRVHGMTFVPVRLPASAVEDAARFNPLRALRPMPKVRPFPVGPLRVTLTSSELPAPPPGQRPQSDMRVAVFDGGVAGVLPQVAPFVNAIDVTTEAATDECLAHGTMVTGALLYGPLGDGHDLRTPDFGVDHFRVVPAPSSDVWDVDLYWILDQIVELVTTRGYRIVNLSLGPALPVEDDAEPHAWTARLDELSHSYGVLFVTAVGNNGELDEATGLNRVQVPSDMVNALSVGACDQRAPGVKWERAPYSAVGPGRPGARLKPCGVAFGGTPSGPFRGLLAGGTVGEAWGTSFAAPTAAHGIASLAARMGAGHTSPDVLRAFALHFADSPTSQPTPEVGAGRLAERYDDHWNCAPNEATILYRDSIERDQSISLPFPLVGQAVAGRMVALSWTVVFTAPTDPTDVVEYTKAGLEVAFRPHSRRFSLRDPDTNKTIVLDVQEEGERFGQLLASGWLPSVLPATKGTERRGSESLKREGGKWETAMHFSKRMRARSLHEPQVTVNYLAREDGRLAVAPPLVFAMLVSLRAPIGVDLYTAVRQQYPLLTPLAAHLPLRLRA
ncbi:MAG: S8 family peptidase [Miltoncostaeaceae bacterium]